MRLLVRGIGFVGILTAAAWVTTCGDRAGNVTPAREDTPPPSSASQKELPPTARPELLESLQEALRAPHSPADGAGRAWLELGPGEEPRIQVRGRRRWTVLYEAGPLGIAEGGFVRLTASPFFDWSPAQGEDAQSLAFGDDAGLTTASTEVEGVRLEPRSTPDSWVDFLVRGRELRKGERVRIIYGAGEGLAVADRYAESGSRLWVSVDGDGDGYGKVLEESPAVSVDPGPARRVEAFLPSTAEPGETVRLRVSLLDLYGNGPVALAGELELASLPEGLDVPATTPIALEDGGKREFALQAPASGVFRLRVRFHGSGEDLETLTNPLVVERNAAPILWGDVHGHSNLSDGSATPEEYLAYARDVAALDVIALTDHDHWGMLRLDAHPAIWESIRRATERFHEPGRFVTLLGYEWTNWIHGHRHVLYFANEGQVYSSLAPEYQTPDQLWAALRGQPALTFAHHSAGGPIATNWDFAPDPELEPVTEVVSVHGASEAEDAPIRIYSALRGNFVRDALDRGYRLGFIGSGDSHDGHPGLPQIASGASGGLAAILTADRTRAGVRAALEERRCYATNGPRIVVRATLDGKRMGESVPASPPGQNGLLVVRAIGTGPIETIEVVRSSEIAARLDAEGETEVLTTLPLEPLKPGEYVYVRVVQRDAGAAWSSPFFVE
jgi:hypothetical protein